MTGGTRKGEEIPGTQIGNDIDKCLVRTGEEGGHGVDQLRCVVVLMRCVVVKID